MAAFELNEEKARLRYQRSKEAVNLALRGDWEEAVAVNRDMIARFPSDVESYNRLGKALTELGDIAGAKEAYLSTLEIDPGNSIAKKNLSRLDNLAEPVVTSDEEERRQSLSSRAQARKVDPEIFTTDMGKAGVVNLCNVASGQVLAKVGLGEQVHLKVDGQRLIVESEEGEYMGQVEPRQGVRLIKMMEGGNRYAAAILSMKEDKIQVVIKEVYQHPSQVGHLSFLVKTTGHHHSRVKEGVLGPNVINNEGDDRIEEVEYFGEGEELLDKEKETLPEGFTIIGEDRNKEEIDL